MSSEDIYNELQRMSEEHAEMLKALKAIARKDSSATVWEMKEKARAALDKLNAQPGGKG